MRITPRAPIGFAAAAALMLGLAGPAAAQAQGAPQNAAPGTASPGAPMSAQPNAGTPSVDVSDQKLRTFIDAATEVQTISEKWQAKAASSESTDEVEEVRRKATEEMVGAVREKGMTVDEFNTISKAAERDPQLKSRIVAMLQQQQR